VPEIAKQGSDGAIGIGAHVIVEMLKLTQCILSRHNVGPIVLTLLLGMTILRYNVCNNMLEID